MKTSILLNKKIFGWYTIFLSSIYFLIALYQLTLFVTSAEFRKYGINILIFPQSFFFIGIGVFRIIVGRLLLKETFDKVLFRFIFGLICFFEIGLGFIYGLALIDRLGLIGNIVVLLFIVYYITALLFFRRLKNL